MKEMNLIGFSKAGYAANGRAAMCSILVPGLQNSRNITPIVVDSPDTNALNITHGLADEKGESLDENLDTRRNGKSDKFMW